MNRRFKAIRDHLERVRAYNMAYGKAMTMICEDLDKLAVDGTPLPDYRKLIKSHIERMEETDDKSMQGIVNAYSLAESSLRGIDIYDEEDNSGDGTATAHPADGGTGE